MIENELKQYLKKPDLSIDDKCDAIHCIARDNKIHFICVDKDKTTGGLKIVREYCFSGSVAFNIPPHPAQREVRYPEKKDYDHSCEFDCRGCISSGRNQAIDEFKKLNGG